MCRFNSHHDVSSSRTNTVDEEKRNKNNMSIKVDCLQQKRGEEMEEITTEAKEKER
jgi:hypothetical protein